MRLCCLAKNVAGFIVGLFTCVIAAAPANAIGYWNVPGNFCQWNGYGCGPGYHAPMMLGPLDFHGWYEHRVQRLPYAPCASSACWDYGCGCGEHGCKIDAPSILEPSAVPMDAPLPAPGPQLAPTPSAFRLPFRR